MVLFFSIPIIEYSSPHCWWPFLPI